MRLAVTGASGVIGRYVLVELVKRQVDVIAITRNPKNLEQWRDRIDIIEMDIGQASPAELDRVAAGTDNLIHLAWDGLPNYQSRHHFECELPKQYRFLKGLVERGLPAMLVAGTCSEYGMQSGALTENSPTLAVHAYGFAKDSLRRQLELLGRDLPFAMTWGRLFYTYGDGQPATSLYPLFRAAVLRGDKFFEMSGGEQLRDYLPLREVASLLVRLAMRPTNAGLVNVCSGQPISVRRLVEGWVRDCGSSIQLNLGRYPYLDFEPLAFWGVRRKLESLLGQP